MVRIAIALLAFASAVSAQTIVIRLGTLAPRNSKWHQLILDMGEKWKQASGGKVELKVFPGGEQGDEPEMVQKMRIHSLQAVAISGAGLSGIDASSAALQIPMMYESWDELDYVRDRIGPQLEKGLATRGFVVLNWGDTGWVHFFSKAPATTPDQFRQMKVCVLQGDAVTFELYKRNGFRPVSLATTDILTGLQTGLIDAFQSPPMVALASQWFGGARNMLDIKFAPLSGATLVTKETWDQIPAAMRPKLLAIAHDSGAQIRQEVRHLEDSSIGMMKGFGLNVVHADPNAVNQWSALIEQKLWPALRGGGMPTQLFDQVKHLRDEYRAAHSGAKPAPKPRTRATHR
ncbi:MAG TPA: TRAP transporter substrate-binding protein DctP [Bryobacteraceae bacterium]|nr:TRAP transporter substrate-binding protein DctP [Bryobacteraceae bacterium]